MPSPAILIASAIFLALITLVLLNPDKVTFRGSPQNIAKRNFSVPAIKSTYLAPQNRKADYDQTASPKWLAKPPLLPPRLQGSNLLDSEELLWSNGALQRRNVYRLPDGSHMLFLETGLTSRENVTRFAYTADRILLVERQIPLTSIVDGLQRFGLCVSLPSPDSPYAYVINSNPTRLFECMDKINQLIRHGASVQLEPLEVLP